MGFCSGAGLHATVNLKTQNRNIIHFVTSVKHKKCLHKTKNIYFYQVSLAPVIPHVAYDI